MFYYKPINPGEGFVTQIECNTCFTITEPVSPGEGLFIQFECNTCFTITEPVSPGEGLFIQVECNTCVTIIKTVRSGLGQQNTKLTPLNGTCSMYIKENGRYFLHWHHNSTGEVVTGVRSLMTKLLVLPYIEFCKSDQSRGKCGIQQSSEYSEQNS